MTHRYKEFKLIKLSLNIRIIFLLIFIILTTESSTVASGTDELPYRSPFELAFSSDGSMLAVTDRTAGQLYIVDPGSGHVVRNIDLHGEPRDVVWSGDDRIIVSEYNAGTVAEVDARTGRLIRRFDVGPKSVGLALAPSKGLLVVCDYGLHQALILELKTGKEKARITCDRHPYFVGVTQDGQTAVVGNLLSSGPATDPKTTAVISIIDMNHYCKIKDIKLPGNSSNVRHVAISKDGRWAYITHTLGRTMLPTTQVERGWINTNALSIIDLEKPERYATVLLDTSTEGAADPWGIALASDGSIAWISIAGTQQIAKIKLARLHDFLAGRGDIKKLGLRDTYSGPAKIWQQIKEDAGSRDRLSYHLSAMYAAEMLSRIRIPAKCPRGIALSPDETCLAVTSYYTGQVLLLDPDRCSIMKIVNLGPQAEPNEVRHGDFVFHNGRHSFQHWLSCSTCHPDGRADSMNWDLLNDGIGNPKNTKSLLWSHKTPPVMSLGVRASMEKGVQKGFQFIQFREVEQGDLNAVQAYLRSMKPELSPHLVEGQLSKKAVKGKDIFDDDEVGCSSCHPGPLYTKMESHDVGTKHEQDRKSSFDTPTCVELWCTGPYLHDGSAVTLKDMLTTMNPDDKHGKTSHLSEEEISALIEYLLSL